jgi:hypothetical protein
MTRNWRIVGIAFQFISKPEIPVFLIVRKSARAWGALIFFVSVSLLE